MDVKVLSRMLKANEASAAKKYYDENFPSSYEDIIDNPDFILKSFARLTAENPYLLVGNEEKLVNFVSSECQYVIDFRVLARGRNRNSVYETIALLGLLPMSKYFLEDASEEKDLFLTDRLEPVIKLVLQGQLLHKGMVDFFETTLPSWRKGYPRTMYLIYSNLYIVNKMSAQTRNVPEKRAEWEEIYRKLVPFEWQHN